MKFADVAQRLGAEVAHRGSTFDREELHHVMASDLMSDVLVVDRSRLLILTALASDQAIRTADMVGAAGVVVVNGKTLPAHMTRLAAELDVTLLRTRKPKFEACVALRELAAP